MAPLGSAEAQPGSYHSDEMSAHGRAAGQPWTMDQGEISPTRSQKAIPSPLGTEQAVGLWVMLWRGAELGNTL